MGLQTVKSVLAENDMELVGALDAPQNAGKDLEVLIGGTTHVIVSDNLEKVLAETKPQVMVDFTKGWIAPSNIITCLKAGCACVVGTTGISEEDNEKIRQVSEETGVPVLVAPNFSLGAVLMMKFAAEAAKYFQWSEIIEFHHERKVDAPSGTAMKTAEMMAENGGVFLSPEGETEKVSGVRGGVYKGVRIHSVRLQGMLAHQEVNFGGLGEVLKIRHDTITRESFMPGVMLAIRKVRELTGFVVGLEYIL
ncbi:MAG: 4-hydroxy-tetrahydrodipicolinate reductase [Firmicutes bacterium]|nr:4-hydroxy-tetrahydrodipicolinate reductase [Bacillota bacterium]